jgi:multidrug efflux system membrane fusion protein
MSFQLRWRFPLALAGLALGLSLAGCGESKPAAGTKTGRGGGAAPVYAGKVQRKVVPLVIEAIGAVEPIRATAVRSQVTGTLQKIAIKEGQDVKAGDLLFEIDARPFVNAVKSAEADLQKAVVQLETARAQVNRYRGLTADQMVSKEQFEKLSDTARALEAEVVADEAKLATARLNVDYCSIRAPIAGRTGNLTVHEGDLVRTNEAGGLLVNINQISPIYVTFGVPQQYLGTLARYRASGDLKVKVTPPGTDEKPEEGTLTFMDNTVDQATGTLKLKAVFPNAAQRLWPGQFGRVSVTLATPEVLVVPTSAVQTSQTGQHVYVIKEDKTAELRVITAERTHENETVIAKGLAEGETIVTDGQLRVVPGRPVDIKDPAGSAPKKGGGKGGDGKGKKGTEEKKAP